MKTQIVVHGYGNIGRSIVEKIKHKGLDFVISDPIISFCDVENIFFKFSEKTDTELTYHFICLNTDVIDENWNTNMDSIYELFDNILTSKRFKNKKNVFYVESTVSPEFVDKVYSIFDSHSLTRNVDYTLVITPERYCENTTVAKRYTEETNKIFGIDCIIVNTVVTNLVSLTKDFYKNIFDEIKLHYTSTKLAILSKLAENTQRYFHLTANNAVRKLIDEVTQDTFLTDEVLKLCNTKSNFVEIKPGLIGGGCIPVDPMFFGKNNDSKISNMITNCKDFNSMLFWEKINEIKKYINGILKTITKKRSHDIVNINIKLFGIEFKPNSNSIKHSKYEEYCDILVDYIKESLMLKIEIEDLKVNIALDTFRILDDIVYKYCIYSNTNGKFLSNSNRQNINGSPNADYTYDILICGTNQYFMNTNDNLKYFSPILQQNMFDTSVVSYESVLQTIYNAPRKKKQKIERTKNGIYKVKGRKSNISMVFIDKLIKGKK